MVLYFNICISIYTFNNRFYICLYNVRCKSNRNSKQFKENGGFIPGVRAGKNTSDYLNTTLKNVTWVGAIFLAAVAVLPVVMQGFMPISITFGGTSVLIVVSVALEVLKGLETQMVSRHYKGFLD